MIKLNEIKYPEEEKLKQIFLIINIKELFLLYQFNCIFKKTDTLYSKRYMY